MGRKSNGRTLLLRPSLVSPRGRRITPLLRRLTIFLAFFAASSQGDAHLFRSWPSQEGSRITAPVASGFDRAIKRGECEESPASLTLEPWVNVYMTGAVAANFRPVMLLRAAEMQGF